jgi:hypothetical protein
VELTNKFEIASKIRANAVKKYKKTTLEDYCAICSMALLTAFQKAGFSAKLVFGKFQTPDRDIKLYYHVWVESDGEIYDITATQFGQDYPPVYVTRLSDPLYIRLDESIDGYTYFEDWRRFNRPTEKRTKELLVA